MTAKRRPYQLWYRMQGTWFCHSNGDCPTEIRGNIEHLCMSNKSATGIERIEFRDYGGVLETVYDITW